MFYVGKINMFQEIIPKGKGSGLGDVVGVWVGSVGKALDWCRLAEVTTA